MKKELQKNQGGFRMPDDYLVDLEDRIVGKGLEQERKFGEFPTEFERHFKVPSDYFEGLEDRITARTRTRIIRLPKPGYRILTLTAAASVALLISLFYWSSADRSNSRTVLGDQDLYDIIANDYNIFSSDDIADAFDDLDLGSEIYADTEIERYLEEVDLENIITEN